MFLNFLFMNKKVELRENIFRVQSLIYENKFDDKIINLLNKLGIEPVVETFGYEVVKPFLTKQDIVSFIKSKVKKISESIGSTGFDVQDFNKPPVFYGEDELYEKEIYYFTLEYLYVDVFSKNKSTGTFTKEYKTGYQFLSDEVLDRVFKLMIELS